MIKNQETSASVGVRVISAVENIPAEIVTVEILKSGYCDLRFGSAEKLGKDGCGY